MPTRFATVSSAGPAAVCRGLTASAGPLTMLARPSRRAACRSGSQRGSPAACAAGGQAQAVQGSSAAARQRGWRNGRGPGTVWQRASSQIAPLQASRPLSCTLIKNLTWGMPAATAGGAKRGRLVWLGPILTNWQRTVFPGRPSQTAAQHQLQLPMCHSAPDAPDPPGSPLPTRCRAATC